MLAKSRYCRVSCWGSRSSAIPLRGEDLLQLRQRVIASSPGAMDETETRHYIEHRMQLAGLSGAPMFTDAAYEEIRIALPVVFRA